MHSKFQRLLAAGLIAGTAITGGPAIAADDEVNVYSYRQEFLLKPFLEKFTEETGIKTNVVYAKKGMLERVKAEGENTEADVIMTVDIGRLNAFKKEGLLQSVSSKTLQGNIPAQYRDPANEWFGLTLRTRAIYFAKDRVDPASLSTYEDLADPRWKGKICVRKGSHRYNVALVASIIAANGEEGAREWVRSLVDNFARTPQGNDRAQVKGIKEGECDLALGNNYYMGKMVTNEKEPEQKEWAASAGLFFPNQDNRGAHMNVSGAAIAKHSKNRENAVKLLEFLSGDTAQQMYASVNFEYPVKEGVAWDPLVKSWGAFKQDTVPLAKIAELSPLAQKIIDEEGWR
ncbi:MAG: Fe(3+) ABC transporter substrate-binding protein [Alphaproteobacteria bacterium]|nr:Fe(3+) ABC transporter substrate-binding protein [Alphaproteobacteria bacterium]